MSISKAIPIFCCLLCLVPCYLAQSVTISVFPDIIYLESDVDVTCQVSGDENTLLSLVPFYVINGTYIQHSCVGSAQYQPLTQRFSTLPFDNTNNSTLITRFSISPVSETDNGLSIACVFFDIGTENNFTSSVIALSVVNTSEPIVPVEITTTGEMITQQPFINSQEFYITVGTVGGFLVLLVVVTLIIILVISVTVIVTKRSKRKETSEPVITAHMGITPQITLATNESASMLAVKKEEDLRDRVDSMKTYNESEAQRYSALPTYSLAVNMERAGFSESTDPSAANQFSTIDIEKEKQETDS